MQLFVDVWPESVSAELQVLWHVSCLIFCTRASLFISQSCSRGSIHSRLLDDFMIPYVWDALHSNTPFYKVSVRALAVSAEAVGLWCDYGPGDFEILIYIWSSRQQLHRTRMPPWGLWCFPPRSSNTLLSSAEPLLKWRRRGAVNPVRLLLLGLICIQWCFSQDVLSVRQAHLHRRIDAVNWSYHRRRVCLNWASSFISSSAGKKWKASEGKFTPCTCTVYIY